MEQQANQYRYDQQPGQYAGGVDPKARPVGVQDPYDSRQQPAYAMHPQPFEKNQPLNHHQDPSNPMIPTEYPYHEQE